MTLMRSFILRKSTALRILPITLLAMALAAACSNDKEDTPFAPSRGMAIPDPAIVIYGPVNHGNPFEEIGLRHNDVVHAGLTGLLPADTASSDIMLQRCVERVREWSAFANYDHEQTAKAIAHALTRDAARDYRKELLDLSDPKYSERELRYLHRLGEVLSIRATFDDVEKEVLRLEKEILSESWPADNRSETAPRIAIAVAKHSFAYWKRVMTLALDLDKLPLGKGTVGPMDIIIEGASAGQMVVAADVAGACAGAEYFAPLGPEKQLIGAVVVGGVSSLGTAVIVYQDKISRFFKRLFGCDR